MPNTTSPTPALDLMNETNPTGYRKCRLKEGALPHNVRKGTVRAGDEFVTEAKHAKELFETGAAEILGIADEPDLSPSERILKDAEDAAKAKEEADRAKAEKQQPAA